MSELTPQNPYQPPTADHPAPGELERQRVPTVTLPEPEDDDEEEPASLSGGNKFDDEMDITPMIDITFLLLIFFVVTSKMDPSQTANMPFAINGTAEKAKECALVFIEPFGEDDVLVSGQIKGAKGKTKFSTDPSIREEEIVDYVSEELNSGKKEVMIMADGNVSVGKVREVQKVITDAIETIDKTFIGVETDG